MINNKQKKDDDEEECYQDQDKMSPVLVGLILLCVILGLFTVFYFMNKYTTRDVYSHAPLDIGNDPYGGGQLNIDSGGDWDLIEKHTGKIFNTRESQGNFIGKKRRKVYSPVNLNSPTSNTLLGGGFKF